MVAAVVVSAFEVVEVVGSGEGLVAGSTELVLTIGCQVVEIVGSGSRVGTIPYRRKWKPTSVFLPGKSHEIGRAHV